MGWTSNMLGCHWSSSNLTKTEKYGESSIMLSIFLYQPFYHSIVWYVEYPFIPNFAGEMWMAPISYDLLKKGPNKPTHKNSHKEEHRRCFEGIEFQNVLSLKPNEIIFYKKMGKTFWEFNMHLFLGLNICGSSICVQLHTHGRKITKTWNNKIPLLPT